MAYTNQMIEKIEKAQPLNLAIAKELASDLGVTYRSIISKAKQMGFSYQAKAPAMKKESKTTKSEMVLEIAKILDCEFIGLDKANISDLETLIKKLSA
jgi:exonuclease V gamma subunit